MTVGETINVVDNLFLQHMLVELRDKNTKCPRFRHILNLMGEFMAYEISKILDVQETDVLTPLGVSAKGYRIRDYYDIVLIAILRASIPMIFGATHVFEEAEIGFISAKRIEGEMSENFEMEVKVEYSNLPNLGGKVVIIMDPMLATGSTLVKILKQIYQNGKPKKVIIASVIATMQGIKRIKRSFSDVIFFTIAIDEKLNSKGYIVPGLGDAGDRAFNC
ncbi:MAG: uracil phosphoribosyltransferase [Candidatus Njordarchaeia archaeon]